MYKFFDMLISTWWGITSIILFCVLVLMVFSILLYKQFFKRFYDVLLSGIAILILLPIFIVLSILGAIKMKGNPFFTQLRPGKNEKIFKLVKFRTMTCEKDENGVLLSDEKRLTKYGRMLRKTSLDELPELFNIFIGDMSIVGPRPQLVRDMVFMSEEVRKRHSVRGGLTGLAQVCGRNNITWEQKFEYDLNYIENISFFRDIKIIFQTVFKVLKRSDVEREGTVSDIDYGDWLLKNGRIDEEFYNTKQNEASKLI